MPGFPNSDEYNVHRAAYRLNASDLFDIFEPIVLDVIKLVMIQLDASSKVDTTNVKAIIMVGGFGENSYLNKRLQQAVASRGVGVRKSPKSYARMDSNLYMILTSL